MILTNFRDVSEKSSMIHDYFLVCCYRQKGNTPVSYQHKVSALGWQRSGDCSGIKTGTSASPKAATELQDD